MGYTTFHPAGQSVRRLLKLNVVKFDPHLNTMKDEYLTMKP